MEQIDLLVQADFLYPMSEGLPIIRGGEVAVRAGRIVYAGPRKPSDAWRAVRTLPGAGKAVLPGFVNSHCHTASLVFRSQTDDHAVAAALYGVAFPMERLVSDEEWHDLALLGCLDMVRAGITTINDIWYAPDGLAQAVERAGLRAMIANKVFDVRLEDLRDGNYQRYPREGDARLRAAVDFAEAWHGAAEGRISARIATHASDTCAAALHKAARAEADRLGLGMHCHAAQSSGEVAQVRAEHGCGPLVYLRDLGYLRDDVVVAHLTYADGDDLAAVAESGARYAHCPTIYPRRGVYPALWSILDQGITTGLASDWMLNDPFEGMRNLIQALRLLRGSAQVMPSAEALWLHTQGAAQVLGLDHEIGSLEAGKRADLIMLDLEQSHLQPFYGGYPALVFYAKASDVVTSVIDGRVVMAERQPVGLDAGAIIEAAKRRTSAWSERLRGLGSTSLAPVAGPCFC